LLLVVKIAKDIIAHCDDVGRWWWWRWWRERKIYHDQIYINQMVALVNGSGTNYAEQKWVWSLVNVDDFGGWRRTCKDRRVMETKNSGMNGMDYIVFISQ
jgi:hypothetical protein